MARSLKKGPYIHYKLEKKVLANVESGKNTVIKTWSRASMISPDFVGQTIGVLSNDPHSGVLQPLLSSDSCV